MGWLSSKGRRQPLEPATFGQTVVIVREILRSSPSMSDFELTERSKEEHLRLRFNYHNPQIHKAVDALTDPARRKEHRTNRRSGRWT